MAVESHKILGKIHQYLIGEIIEIGCGDETIIPGIFGVDGRDFPCVSFRTENLYDLPTQLPEKVGTFDACISSHVLEHLPDSYRAIMEWGHFLKRGGYFILYLPEGSAYNNFENREHFHDTRHESFLLWIKRAFCGEALNFKGEQYAPPIFSLIEDGLDVGENRYSFYCVLQKL